MKKMITFLFTGLLFLSSCSSEEIRNEMNTLNATTSTVQVADYTMTDLVGRWNIFSMSSVDTSVDFDRDGTRTNDLLAETDCFGSMYFDFKETGYVETKQSRLYFSEVTGQFSCQTSGDYSAAYTVSGNQLTVNFTIDGHQYTETKTIALYSENGNEFLKVTLTKEETNSAVYVAKDPGNTVASEIQKIETVYKKQ